MNADIDAWLRQGLKFREVLQEERLRLASELLRVDRTLASLDKIERSAEPKEQAADRVTAFLGKLGAPARIADIASGTNTPAAYTGIVLRRLERIGAVSRDGFLWSVGPQAPTRRRRA